jgi:ABC-type transport system involved in multi-copper enzyme maturation permease subunit
MIRALASMPMALRIICSVLMIPLALVFVASILLIEALVCILCVPILPFYTGRGLEETKQINKINPFMIFNQEIMGWRN